MNFTGLNQATKVNAYKDHKVSPGSGGAHLDSQHQEAEAGGAL